MAGADFFSLFGSKIALPISATNPSKATIKNVARHPNICPIQVPNGTPVTKATVKPVNIIAIALASLSLLTKLVAMVEPIEKNTP